MCGDDSCAANHHFCDLDAQDRLIRLNVTAVTRPAGAVVPRLLAEGSGAIVNITSVVALAPEIFPGIYPATRVSF